MWGPHSGAKIYIHKHTHTHTRICATEIHTHGVGSSGSKEVQGFLCPLHTRSHAYQNTKLDLRQLVAKVITQPGHTGLLSGAGRNITGE